MYKTGDVVILTDVRPTGWNQEGSMDCYLGAVVEIGLKIDSEKFRLKNDAGWLFKLTDIVGYANEELRAQKALEQTEKLIGYCFSIEDIRNIAYDVFGEERVEIIADSSNYVILTIHFPEIHITNTKEERHDIKDMFIRFYIKLHDIDEDYKLEISMHGARTSISIKEYEYEGYRHSHLIRGNIGEFSEFCLGYSDFKMIMQTIVLEPTPENWYLLFLSIENYLSWESLEGGPYCKIGSLRYQDSNISGIVINEAFDKIYKNIPNSVLEISDGSLSLIHDSVELHEYYRTNSELKTLYNVNKGILLNTLNMGIKDKGLTFNNRKIPYLYYLEDVDSEQNTQYSMEVTHAYNELLQNKLKEFNNVYTYNLSKRNNTKDIFGQVGTF